MLHNKLKNIIILLISIVLFYGCAKQKPKVYIPDDTKGSSQNPYENYIEAANDLARKMKDKALDVISNNYSVIVGKTKDTPKEAAKHIAPNISKYNFLKLTAPEDLLPVLVRSRDQFDLGIYKQDKKRLLETADIVFVVDVQQINDNKELFRCLLIAIKEIKGKSEIFRAGIVIPTLVVDGYVKRDISKKLVQKIPLVNLPAFVKVPKNKYKIPENLFAIFYEYTQQEYVDINSFEIMAEEIKVKHFQQYYDSLSEDLKKRIGNICKRTNPDAPVEDVPYEFVDKYIKWLNQKTGRNYRLPTVQEWIAACVYYNVLAGKHLPIYSEEEPMSELRNGIIIDHLLGNLREWSRTQCGDDGRLYLLGTNYISPPGSEEKAYCAFKNSAYTAGVGFRLVK